MSSYEKVRPHVGHELECDFVLVRTINIPVMWLTPPEVEEE